MHGCSPYDTAHHHACRIDLNDPVHKCSATPHPYKPCGALWIRRYGGLFSKDCRPGENQHPVRQTYPLPSQQEDAQSKPRKVPPASTASMRHRMSFLHDNGWLIKLFFQETSYLTPKPLRPFVRFRHFHAC